MCVKLVWSASETVWQSVWMQQKTQTNIYTVFE
jgi:hypothetical protein